jgi:endonuclease/exonuclease/phosphatase (EEP) superfamily protein YafD
MNAATRKKLFDALTASVRADPDCNEMVLRFVTENTNIDIDKIAPAIDELMREREAELLKPMPCGHPTAMLELAPLEEQPVMLSANTGWMMLNPQAVVYRCAGCRCQQQFVRKFTEHVKKLFTTPTSFATVEALEREIASIT